MRAAKIKNQLRVEFEAFYSLSREQFIFIVLEFEFGLSEDYDKRSSQSTNAALFSLHYF